MGEQQQLAGAAPLCLPGPALQRSVCEGWALPVPPCRSPSAQAWGGGLPRAPWAWEACPGSPYTRFSGS